MSLSGMVALTLRIPLRVGTGPHSLCGRSRLPFPLLAPRLQAKPMMAKCEGSEHEPSFPLDGGRSGWGCSGTAVFPVVTPSLTLPHRGGGGQSRLRPTQHKPLALQARVV